MMRSATLKPIDNPGLIYDPGVKSRKDLQVEPGLPIDTFAPPFAAAKGITMTKISKQGYKAAVGLGTSPIQGPFYLFYLNRIVLDYTIDINRFTAFCLGLDP